VYTHSSMPDEPLVVLHTALSDEIARSMKGIVSATSRMSGKIYYNSTLKCKGRHHI
jgi:malonyl-CoA decarboxylase